MAPEQIFLLIAGALYPDLDHDVKTNIVNRGILLSSLLILISVMTFLLDLFTNSSNFNINMLVAGVLIFLVYLIPANSKHRGFTHTIYCMILCSTIIGYYTFQLSFLTPLVVGLLALLMTTTKKLFKQIIPIGLIIMIIVYSFNIKIGLLNYNGALYYIIPVMLGYLSHIVADSFTPAGVKALEPFNSYKFKRFEGIIIMIIWLIIVVFLINSNYNIFNNGII